MKKIKTSEQYVIHELERARKEIAMCHKIIDAMQKIGQVQIEVEETIKKNLELRPAPGGETELISMGLIFEQYDKKDFDLLKNYFFSAEKDDESEDGEG